MNSYTYIYVYIYIHIYIHVYTNTYIHTYIDQEIECGRTVKIVYIGCVCVFVFTYICI